VINDTVGHDVGDDLLKQAAQRLRAVVRDVDTVARLGGDEFTAILSNCDHAIANQIAQRIIDDLATSYQIESRSLYVTASVGVAFYPEDGTDSGTLIKAADTAMYRAKEAGRNRIAFFKPEMHTRLLKRTAIESGLRDALGQGRFALAFQPKFSVETPHRLLGAEALLRWNDPVLGQVSPAEFIPVAESSGQIREISRFVVTSLL
ncbi:MAG: diguanylate cyclase, partial [Candidatus Competibacteraceae bacterium]|nr:diguanylate cyclase [Candidatus Competibacteraceae bacterium]